MISMEKMKPTTEELEALSRAVSEPVEIYLLPA